MMQFPWAFEFTQDLLLELALHSASGRFGDFFCNSMQKREALMLWLKTPSLFKYLSALWKLGRFRHGDYIPTKTVLRPRTNVRDMMLWDEVYCRFTAHDKDRHSSSIFNAIRAHSASTAAAVMSSGAGLSAFDTPRRGNAASPSLPRQNGFGWNSKRGRESPVNSPSTNGVGFRGNVDDEEKSPNRHNRPRPPPPKKLNDSDTTPVNVVDSRYFCVRYFFVGTNCVHFLDLNSFREFE